MHKTLKSSVVQRHHMVRSVKVKFEQGCAYLCCTIFMKSTQEAQAGSACKWIRTLVKPTWNQNYIYFFNACSYCNLSPCPNRQTVSYHAFEHRFYSLKRDEKHPWDVSMKLKAAFLLKIHWCILFQKNKNKKVFIIFNQNVITCSTSETTLLFGWLHASLLLQPFSSQLYNNHFSQYDLFQIHKILSYNFF